MKSRQFALKGAFPAFIRSHPTEAISALIEALEGYIANSHRRGDGLREETVTVGAFDVKLVEDRSHIWAWKSLRCAQR